MRTEKESVMKYIRTGAFKQGLCLFIATCMLLMLNPGVASAEEQNTEATSRADIVFVIDSTDSTEAYFSSILSSIKEFADYLGYRGLDLRLSIIEYRDIDSEGLDSTIVHTNNHSPWMNIDEFVGIAERLHQNSAVPMVTASHSTPIDALGFLGDESVMRWSTKAERFAFLITGSDFDVSNRHDFGDISEMADVLAAQGIRTSIMTHIRYQMQYAPLAAQTGGQWFDINLPATSMEDFASSVLGVTEASRAIYVLPGYMGSRLFLNSEQVWMDEEGLARAVPRWDPYGTENMYQELIHRLRADFVDSGDFDEVIFFSYNWLGDLNESARLLEADIRNRGFEQVVFVAHGAGGLLAANYIANDRSNKLGVEGIFMLGVPFYGTLASVEMLEFGMNAMVYEALDGQDPFTQGMEPAQIRRFVHSAVVDSPVTYQLLPSSELLMRHPMVSSYSHWEWNGQNPSYTISTQWHRTADEMYSVLNDGDFTTRVNTRLTSGPLTSHRHFRDLSLGGCIESLLRQVPNVYLLGNFNGEGIDDWTPTWLEYGYWRGSYVGARASVRSSPGTGDGWVTGYSATMGFSPYFESRSRHFPGVGHRELVRDSDILDFLSEGIRNISSGSSSGMEAETSSDYSAYDLGLEEHLLLNVVSDELVNIEVLDVSGTIVAAVTETEEFGFGFRGLRYGSMAEDFSTSVSELILPRGGYSVRFTSTVPGEEVNFSLILSPLDEKGNPLGMVGYRVATAGEEYMILELDLSADVTLDNPEDLIVESGISPEMIYLEFNVAWELEVDSLVLEDVGESVQIPIPDTGVRNLVWASSDEDVVIVSDGIVTATGYGVAMVYAYANDLGAKMQQFPVRVPRAPVDISFDDVEIAVGERFLLESQFSDRVLAEIDLFFEIDEDYIIEIDNGVIIGLNPGTTQVTGIVGDGIEDEFLVTVSDGRIQGAQSISLSLDRAELFHGEDLVLTAEVYPADASVPDIDWFFEGDSAVKVLERMDEMLVVRGIQVGESTITAMTLDGGFTASATAVVNARGEVALSDGEHEQLPLSDRQRPVSDVTGFESAEGLIAEATHGTFDETNQEAFDETTQEVHDETTQGTFDETTQGVHDETTQGIHDETTQGTTDGVSEETGWETTEGIHGESNGRITGVNPQMLFNDIVTSVTGDRTTFMIVVGLAVLNLILLITAITLKIRKPR